MAKYGFDVANGLERVVSRLHRKAISALNDNMVDGEQVKAVVTGAASQAIIGTDRRAFVFKKGLVAGASFGSEFTSWDYRNLVGVQIHTGMMSGAVILQAPGQSGTRTSTWSLSNEDPYKAPNAIPIQRPYDDAKRGAAELRQLISNSHQKQFELSSVPVDFESGLTVSIADELSKLAELRSSGVLSEDEFSQLKSQLLER